MQSVLTQPTVKAAQAESGQEVIRGQMKVMHRTLKVVTASRVELHNISDRVRDQVRESGIKAGFLILSSLHTTTALFLNEFQAALMADLTECLERARGQRGRLPPQLRRLFRLRAEKRRRAPPRNAARSQRDRPDPRGGDQPRTVAEHPLRRTRRTAPAHRRTAHLIGV